LKGKENYVEGHKQGALIEYFCNDTTLTFVYYKSLGFKGLLHLKVAVVKKKIIEFQRG